MAQIDSYLKRLVSENTLSYQGDFLDLYNFIPNEDLKRFWEKGTNPDKSKRFSSVDELQRAIKNITDDNK